MTSVAKLEVGDVVELKSGSQRMTVTDVMGDGSLRCYFANAVGNFDTFNFPVAALRKVDIGPAAPTDGR